jgi:hypothetical protein
VRLEKEESGEGGTVAAGSGTAAERHVGRPCIQHSRAKLLCSKVGLWAFLVLVSAWSVPSQHHEGPQPQCRQLHVWCLTPVLPQPSKLNYPAATHTPASPSPLTVDPFSPTRHPTSLLTQGAAGAAGGGLHLGAQPGAAHGGHLRGLGRPGTWSYCHGTLG